MNRPMGKSATKSASAGTDPTRALAFALLVDVFEHRRPLEDALDRLPAAEPRDRAAAHRLAATVLRRSGTLDAVLEPHVRKAPPERVRLILLLGAAQLLLLQTPAHAAVATSVALARAEKLAPFAALVNAVLRRVAEGGADSMAGLDTPRLDTPAWLWTSWGARARDIALAHREAAPIDLTLQAGAPPVAEGFVLPNGSVRLPAGTRIAALPGYEGGDFWVQDAAAALPARLLAPRPGERIADLCAAPGGKTAQLAAAGADVTAIDRDARRLSRLRENLGRLKLQANCVQEDALIWRPREKLDAVLLDAPCSATGTIRRHPDVLHLKRPRDVQALAEGQVALARAASAMLRPGGRLIYAVCSLQPEEGEEQIGRFAAFGLSLLPFTQTELGFLPEALTAEGTLRTDPAQWADKGGIDGFFCARFVRQA
jgi:16S rRNA (cytosine967-C5)-methyltransferase